MYVNRFTVLSELTGILCRTKISDYQLSLNVLRRKFWRVESGLTHPIYIDLKEFLDLLPQDFFCYQY